MQRIINYGSFLQAYALKKTIENFADTNSVIFADYRIGKPLLISKHTKTNKIKNFLNRRGKILDKIRFHLFRKRFPDRYFHYLGIDNNMVFTPEVDVLIIGSDEVFNCLQSSCEVGYSLELFGKNSNAKTIISYAASFGNTTYERLLDSGVVSDIAPLLNHFDAISVRDSNSFAIVQSISNIRPVMNIDPVLLYDFSTDSMFNVANSKEKYLLVYAYSGRINEEEARVIRKRAKDKHLKVYCIGGVQLCCDKLICCSPFQIFHYFKNATEVVTDTFHGSIFSMITKANFITLVRSSEQFSYGNEEKLLSLLKQFGLENRVCKNLHKMSEMLDSNIDFSTFDQRLIIERENSISFLSRYLKKED